jgi:hypothetical protein
MTARLYHDLDDTVYFWFAANDTSGSGGDGATPAADVRLAGAAASAAPVYSPTPALLTHANYPAGCYELAIAATGANGFATGNTYSVFCTLAIDSQNPTGFIGSFNLDNPVQADVRTWITADVNALQSGRVDSHVGNMAASVITNTAINTDAIDADAIAANAIGSSELADNAITDTILSTNAKRSIRGIFFGSSDSGSTTTIVDSDLTSVVTDSWKYCAVVFHTGSLEGVVRLITDFSPGTDTLTFTPAAPSAVASHSYEIIPIPPISLEMWKEVVPNTLVSGAVDADVSAIQSGAITAASIAANAIGASEIATGAIDADAIATNAITASKIATGAITQAKFANNAIDTFVIQDGCFTEPKFASTFFREIRSTGIFGNAEAGGSTTTMVDSTILTSALTDVYKGWWVYFTSGNLNGFIRQITAFDPATDKITFAPSVPNIPNGHSYELLPNSAVDVRLWNGTTPNDLVSGAVDADVSAIQSGAITAAAIANAAIDAATFAAGAIDDAVLAADAETAIADAVLSRDVDQVEATMALHSLGTAVLKAVSRIRDNAGTLEIYRTNGSTLHMSQTITEDVALGPIDELTAGV